MDPVPPNPSDALGERTVIEFGAFDFRTDTLELRHDHEPVALPPKASLVLGTLLREAGGLVTREALYEAAWPRTVIEFDQALNTSIRQLRAALGDDTRAPTYIETVPRRGYRFRHPHPCAPRQGGPFRHALGAWEVSDGSVVWARSFNPFCPQIHDPVGAIGYYVARQLRRSVDALS